MKKGKRRNLQKGNFSITRKEREGKRRKEKEFAKSGGNVFVDNYFAKSKSNVSFVESATKKSKCAAKFCTHLEMQSEKAATK